MRMEGVEGVDCDRHDLTCSSKLLLGPCGGGEFQRRDNPSCWWGEGTVTPPRDTKKLCVLYSAVTRMDGSNIRRRRT